MSHLTFSGAVGRITALFRTALGRREREEGNGRSTARNDERKGAKAARAPREGSDTSAEPLPASEMPLREDRKPGLGKDGSLVADLLKLLLKIRARDIDVAPRLLARSEELEALAAGVRHDLAILEGWRFDQFGRDALDLVEGRLGFAVLGGKLKMTRTENEA